MVETLSITIGLCSFNSEKTIIKALEAALTQELLSREIIIVDDCSQDRSYDYLQGMTAKYPELLRLFRFETNQGAAVARNKVIEMATGDFIVFLDDDDVSHPDRALKQIQAILRYEEKYAQGAPVICHTARTQIFPDGTRRYIGTMGCVTDCTAPKGIQAARGMMFGDPVPGGLGSLATCSQAARTSTYRLLGGFDPSFRRMEDTELCLRFAQMGGHFLGLSEPLVDQYVDFPADKKIDQERQYAIRLMDKHRDFFIQSGRGDFDRRWIDIRHDFLEKKNRSFIYLFITVFLAHPFLTGQKIFRALPNVMIHIRHRFWASRGYTHGR